MIRTRTFSGLIALLLLTPVGLAPDALAGSPMSADDEASEEAVPARFTMGVKFGGGGALWDEPDNTTIANLVGPSGATGETFGLPLFDETRGGWVATTGFFVQGTFFEHLGLEVGLHFVQHNLLEKIDWSFVETTTINGVVQPPATFEAVSDQELSWTALHVPILVKAVVPSGTTRLSLGVGPEFSFSSWARSKFIVRNGKDAVDVDNDGVLDIPGDNRSQFKRLLANLEDSVYINVVFGVEILIGEHFSIPIDISWSYNFSQETDYLERGRLDRQPPSGGSLMADDPATPTVDEGNHPTELTLKTRDSMYGVVRVGLAYTF